ncbi:hypothetical protein AAG906_016564 [Vitis piasezkii]
MADSLSILLLTRLSRGSLNSCPQQVQFLQSWENGKGKENQSVVVSIQRGLLETLGETFNMNRSRILAFKNKPHTPVKLIPDEFYSSVHQSKPSKPLRHIPQTPEKTLDAPDIIDDFCLNLMDWGSSNVLALALQNTVYLWDASNGSASELVTFDGRYIAIGLKQFDVQLWDSTANRLLRTLRGGHQSRVGSLDWKNHILTTGGMDGQIINNDVRVHSHIVATFRGHRQEVCGLKWSTSGQQLASGGNDNLLYIWDRSMASMHSRSQWLHRLEDHTAAVKALSWCPFQRNLLASGGGGSDCCIKFWNTHTGACLNSVDTGSQVCSLLWNKNARELLSSHGFMQNQLTLGCIHQCPDGRLATAGDETLKFGMLLACGEKVAPKASIRPFPHIRRIHSFQEWENWQWSKNRLR